MANFKETMLLRSYIRARLTEDVYAGGKFMPDRAIASVDRYLGGDLPALGVSPEIAEEVTLDDLRSTFGEEGWDVDSELQRAVEDRDKNAARRRVKEILNTGFISPTSSLGKKGFKSIDDALLPGDEDRLIQVILDDLFDSDGVITIY